MDKELRLERVDLGDGWIDLGYGEPLVIKKILHKHLSDGFLMPSRDDLLNAPYHPPRGMKKLTDLLEKKYSAKVVITNGAKQGISAVMYALKKAGHKSCAMHRPHWTSTPGLIESQGLEITFIDESEASSDAFLLTSPNNPDGREVSKQDMIEILEDAKKEGVKFIHDGAYYNPIYSNEDTSQTYADITIFSFAKMWGLSGLRLGYVVVRDESLLPGIVEHVEKTCSGVSTASQQIAFAIESHFMNNPELLHLFHDECRKALMSSKEEVKKLDSDYLEFIEPNSNTMFAWCKIGPKLEAAKAKVNIVEGTSFGKPGYARLNMAIDSDIIKNAVYRLNGNYPKEG